MVDLLFCTLHKKRLLTHKNLMIVKVDGHIGHFHGDSYKCPDCKDPIIQIKSPECNAIHELEIYDLIENNDYSNIDMD